MVITHGDSLTPSNNDKKTKRKSTKKRIGGRRFRAYVHLSEPTQKPKFSMDKSETIANVDGDGGDANKTACNKIGVLEKTQIYRQKREIFEALLSSANQNSMWAESISQAYQELCWSEDISYNNLICRCIDEFIIVGRYFSDLFDADDSDVEMFEAFYGRWDGLKNNQQCLFYFVYTAELFMRRVNLNLYLINDPQGWVLQAYKNRNFQPLSNKMKKHWQLIGT